MSDRGGLDDGQEVLLLRRPECPKRQHETLFVAGELGALGRAEEFSDGHPQPAGDVIEVI